ncbi:MAG: PhoH family protein [bacterium]|nr:PhoH family protein [bacterium]
MNAQKHFVLDTNVLIHNPDSLFSFTDNIVVLPITVIEELDKLKAISDKKGMHARQALRTIDSLIKKGDIHQGLKTPGGGKLKIMFHPAEKKTDVEKLPDLDYKLQDNKIIAVAWALQQKKETVFFISKDVNARIKAEALNIKARDYEKEKVEYMSLYKGWREISLTPEEVHTLFSKHKLDLKSYTLQANEYACIKSIDGSHTSALCRYDAKDSSASLITEHFDAMGIKPLNLEQQFAFDMLLNDNIPLITLVGPAGTGKTLIALACGLQKTIGNKPRYKKLLVARPIIPLGRDIGYLPGSKDQKLNYWMQPVFDNLSFILHTDEIKDGDLSSHNQKKKTRIDNLLDSGTIEIEAITYIRGRSIPKQFIIIDEAQNLTPHEIRTIVSRAGSGTKIVLTGDPEQIDNPYLDANSNGLSYAAERLKNQDLTGHMLLSKSERSELASIAVEYL